MVSSILSLQQNRRDWKGLDCPEVTLPPFPRQLTNPSPNQGVLRRHGPSFLRTWPGCCILPHAVCVWGRKLYTEKQQGTVGPGTGQLIR